MVARTVGVITVVAALFGWMSGYQQAMSPAPFSVDSRQQQTSSPISESSSRRSVSESKSEEILSIPVEWRSSNQSRDWNYIVIHHSASEEGNLESIHELHLNRKDQNGNSWLGIGYHFVIGNGQGMGDGEIEPTFRWREQLQGAHAGNEEYNEHGIGIVLVGNFEQSPPTSAQLESVRRLVRFLKWEYDITSDKIVGHRDIKATACPGKLFPLAEIAKTEYE